MFNRRRLTISLIFAGALAALGAGYLRADSIRLALSYYRPVAALGFENGSLSGWQTFRLAGEDAARVVTSPVRGGKYAAAITLHPRGRYGDAFKSELSDAYHAPFGEEIWYRLSHYLAPDFSLPASNYCVLAQWHSVSPAEARLGAKPPVALRYANGRMKITVSFSREPFRDPKQVTTTTLYEAPFPNGAWHDFVYRVVFAGDDSGRLDVWHNGRRVVSYAGPVGYPGDPLGPYFKTGMYCLREAERPLTAYVDEFRRGQAAGDVLLAGEKLEGQP